MNTVSASEKTLPIPRQYISSMKETEQNPRYHAEGNVYNHTLLVLEQFRKHADDVFGLNQMEKEVLYWSVILHDIGKPEVTVWKNGHWSARGHEEAGVTIARNILMKRPEISREQRHRILDLIRWHSVPLRWGLRNEGVNTYKRLATQIDMRLLGIFAYFDFKGRLCESPEILSDLLNRYNGEIMPQIYRDLGTFSEIQNQFQTAGLQKKNALWYSLMQEDIGLLEKVLRTPEQQQQNSQPPFQCVMLIGPEYAEEEVQKLKEEFLTHLPFEIPYAGGEVQKKLIRTIKNAIHVYAQTRRPLLFYGNLLEADFRQEITRLARQAGAEICYVFVEQAMAASEEDAWDKSGSGHLHTENKHQTRPHPWEAHKWEFRSSPVLL